MKRNVDLTEHRIFSNGFMGIPNALVDIMGVHFLPWDFERMRVVTSDYELEERIPLFLCGNATQRQKLREWKMYEDGTICERCGATILIKPWEEFRGMLCHRCHADLDMEFDLKWRFKKEDPVTTSRDFLVVEMNRRLL